MGVLVDILKLCELSKQARWAIAAGVTFRGFEGSEDFELIAQLITDSLDVDGIDNAITPQDVELGYQVANFIPSEDVLFAEAEGQPIAYGALWWDAAIAEPLYLYSFVLFVTPQGRALNVRAAMLDWVEMRSRQLSTSHPTTVTKAYETYVHQQETDFISLLERRKYQPIRYDQDMVCDDLNNLPSFELPAGISIRPPQPKHYRAIWAREAEDFLDHWGQLERSEEDYLRWINNKKRLQPDLWQIAWDDETNEIVGQLRANIDAEKNEKYDRKAGYISSLSVCRRWRQRGLARALDGKKFAAAARSRYDPGQAQCR